MTYVIHGATGAQGGPLLARLTGSGQRAVAAVRNTVAAKGVPAVAVDTVHMLLEATRHTAARAVRPALGDRHGHPVLWRRDVLPLLRAADATRGARAVMHELVAAGAVLNVPVTDTGVLIDIDTHDEYVEELRHRAGQ